MHGRLHKHGLLVSEEELGVETFALSHAKNARYLAFSLHCVPLLYSRGHPLQVLDRRKGSKKSLLVLRPANLVLTL